MPSNAIDMNENVAYTFSVGNHGTGNYPSPYMTTINDAGSPGGLHSPKAGNGSDETDNHWGEYVSVSIDPKDDLTFWGTGEFFGQDQTGVCDNNGNDGANCKWETQIFNCTAGSGFCQ